MIQIGASAATIDTPIEHLMTCRRRIEQRLDTLVLAAAHLESNRTAALEAIRKSFEFLDTSGALHTEDEEGSLFPRLRPTLLSPELAFVDSLEAQHAQAGALYAQLKEHATTVRRRFHRVLSRVRHSFASFISRPYRRGGNARA